MTMRYGGHTVPGATQTMSQREACKQKILELIDLGYTEKHKIYDEVIASLKVPRPTVRRVCHELVKDLKKKVAILDEVGARK